MERSVYKAAWLLPAFLEGSGGHRTILQNVAYLAEHGYVCDVYIEDNGQVKDAEQLKMLADKYFGRCHCRYVLGYHLHGNYDLVFATVWYTAKIVRSFAGNAKKIYFIQDYEPFFYPVGENYLEACDSYCQGLYPVTIGRWLSKKMQQDYHIPSQYFDFCADTAAYRRIKIKQKKAVCFIYQPEKKRRCANLGIAALGIVKYIDPDINIYLYGSNARDDVWFEHKNLKLLNVGECNKLYNQCTVGLCISASNPSRVPFEMMAAGLPVVDVFMENNLYDMPPQGISLAHFTPEAIAQALLEILHNPDKREKMSKAGQEYMKEKTIEYGCKQFLSAVERIRNNEGAKWQEFPKLYQKQEVTADTIRQTLTKDELEILISRSKGRSLAARLKRNPRLKNNKIIRSIYCKIRGF